MNLVPSVEFHYLTLLIIDDSIKLRQIANDVNNAVKEKILNFFIQINININESIECLAMQTYYSHIPLTGGIQYLSARPAVFYNRGYKKTKNKNRRFMKNITDHYLCFISQR